ncbi:MAG: alpha/beta hydrolase [Ignavibacteriae bacterium]|nr:MAG: alpha/beta hydrolase [Ignavibacteriota bacterium]
MKYRNAIKYHFQKRSNQIPKEMRKSIIVVILLLFLSNCSMNISKEADSSKGTFDYSDKIQINYEIHGTGNSTIVFLHGFGASVETWRDIQLPLSKGNTLIFLDLKGFGLSSKPDDGKYSLDDQAEIVLAFLKTNHFHNITLVGNSYGGAVSVITYFKDRSDNARGNVHRLVLIDAAAYEQVFPFFIDVLRKPVINWIVMNLVPTEIMAGFILHYLYYDANKVSEERIARHAEYLGQPGSYDSFVGCARQMIPANPDSLSALIKTIAVPTLIIWGANDPAIPLEHGQRLHREIQNSQLVIIPNCGHMPQEESPDETVKALLKFME